MVPLRDQFPEWERLHMKVLRAFWAWYDRHYELNVAIAAGLFVLQLVHLYWLATDVVMFRLMGESFFAPPPFWEAIIIAVDFTEIPALISASVLYVHEFRMGKRWKGISFNIFIHSQWFHLFWITDEFVVSQLVSGKTGTVLPAAIAWIAIFIDYLELPVIADTVAKFFQSLYRHRIKIFLQREVGYNFFRKWVRRP